MPRATLHDWDQVELFRKQQKIDPDRIRRMRYAFYHSYEPPDQALARLGDSEARALGRQFVLQSVSVASRENSTLDRSTKLLLATGDNGRIETVLLRAASGRMAVCVSTQVGCDAGCPFCATARLGLTRNLSAGEIVDQVLVAGRLARFENRRIKNVVFMGMGEPLDNEASLHGALDRLLHPHACRFAPRRLTVSTVGIPDAMCRLIDRFPGIQLALSLHSARPELRRKLVPWTRRHSWSALREALRYVAARHAYHRHQTPVMIEHLLIDGVNDTDEDAEALVEYVAGIPVHVNLIPYNTVDHATNWRATPRARRDQFAHRLRAAGLFTTIRYSMGADIAAACGQLAGRSVDLDHSVRQPSDADNAELA